MNSYGYKTTRPGDGPVSVDYNNLRQAVAEVREMRLSARRELEMARQIRAEARRYQQETATRARSDAQALILKARLTTRREIEALVRKTTEEVQRVLADIRVIRITAQEELAAQRKFTDAARLYSMSNGLGQADPEPEEKKKQRITAAT
jgi:hypothetical protein